jgi:transposase
MHIEEVRKKHGEKIYITTLIRENYRENGKVRHRTIANISNLPKHVIQGIKILIKSGEVDSHNLESLKITNSREYGASNALMNLIKRLELDKTIYSRKVSWQQDVLAMIIGRIVYQGSKLHLTQLHKVSILWELIGFKNQNCPNVEEHCYKSLDRLLERQKCIQKELAKKHLTNGSIILYDITSSYFEGEYEESELVTFGYSRDKKRNHEQIVIGLLTSEFGCPIAVEVFSGNTSDQTTVLDQAKKLADDYNVKDIVFVGDRGMLTSKRISEVNALGYKTLTVLNRAQIKELLDQGIITTDQFTVKDTIEVIDPKNPAVRYFLCKNPEKVIENKDTRDCLIAKTKESFEQIANSKKQTEQQKCASIGKFLAKYKVGKFFNWEFKNNKFIYQVDDEKIIVEQALDGCYIVRTDSANIKKEEAVKRYKSLGHVERAFRNIKTMSIEIRPVYHQLDKRIKAHVVLCMLAYYVEWHAMQLLYPLFEQDGKGPKKCFSFERVILSLRTIMIQDCVLGEAAVTNIITTPDDEQKKILGLLACSQKREI